MPWKMGSSSQMRVLRPPYWTLSLLWHHRPRRHRHHQQERKTLILSSNGPLPVWMGANSEERVLNWVSETDHEVSRDERHQG